MSDELEELRRKRLLELQNQQNQFNQEAQRQKEMEEYERQKQSILRSILTDGAKQRLTNVKLVKPQLADAIEMQLIQLAQSGRLRGNLVTEEQLLQLLRQIQGNKREPSIKFKRV